MKQYRLLRNNKETGPHTDEELIRLGFKKYDLIWAEGKSAAWRYPGELEEFKSHAPVIEEQPFDRFYKKPVATSYSTKKEPVFTQIAEAVLPVYKKEKPRIKIKGDCKKIEQAKSFYEKQPAPEPQSDAVTPEWKDMWLDWEQEKKAVIKVSAKIYNNAPLETKYEQPLSEIKERYAETVLKQKKNVSFLYGNNFATAVILIAAILGIGIWMGFKWSTNGAEPKPDLEQYALLTDSVNTERTLELNNAQQPANDIVPDQDEEILPALENVQKNIKVITAVQQNSNTPKQKEQVNKNIPAGNKKPPVKQMAIKPVDVTKPESVTKTTPTNKSIDNPVDSKPATVTESADISKLFRKSSYEPQIKDYIFVESYTPSKTEAGGTKYRVQNIADIPVDMVMINLQYFDAAGHYQKGETVYVRNLASGKTVTVAAPDNKNTAKINYQISMVSSEANNLYLIAD